MSAIGIIFIIVIVIIAIIGWIAGMYNSLVGWESEFSYPGT